MLQKFTCPEKVVVLLPVGLPRDWQDKSQYHLLQIPTGLLGFNSVEPQEAGGIFSLLVLLILGISDWYMGVGPNLTYLEQYNRSTAVTYGNEEQKNEEGVNPMDKRHRLLLSSPSSPPKIQMSMFVALCVHMSVMFQAVLLFSPDLRWFLLPFLISFFFSAVVPAQRPRPVDVYCHWDFSLFCCPYLSCPPPLTLVISHSFL